MYNFNIKITAAVLVYIFFSITIFAQDNDILLKDAKNLELKFNEPGALEKYKLLAWSDASNIPVLVKCAELNCSIGERQKDKKIKTAYFDSAGTYAQKAYQSNPKNADACYAMALVAAKKTETDDENKKIVEEVKQIKIYADESLALNSNHAKANYILGK